MMFFLQPSIIGRCVVLTLMVIAEFWAIQLMSELLNTDHPIGVVAGFLMYIAAFLPGIFVFLLTAMFCFTIVEDTANGQEKIESWPELSLFSWFESALFFSAAFFLAGLPGALLSGALGAFNVSFFIAYLLSPVLLLTSLVLLFPPILICMLEAGSVMEPLSANMMQSFAPLARFWIRFYLLSLAIGLAGLVVFNLAFSFGWFTMLPAAAILTALPFLYFRLLGRMAMMYRDYVAYITPDEEESGPAVRHVIQ